MKYIFHVNNFSQIKKKLVCATSCILFTFILNTSGFSQSIYNYLPIDIDTSKKYIFYLHGKIIEDKGIRPTSEKYGIYEYEKILLTFSDKGFFTISEARKTKTQIWIYENKVASQIDSLINAGVDQTNITVVGASKGAAITVLISHLLKNDEVNFVIMAICNESMGEFLAKNDIQLWGNVLYIYDSSDEVAGSCNNYLETLKSHGLKKYKEIELTLGMGHGFLYLPLKDWVEPVIEWANQ